MKKTLKPTRVLVIQKAKASFSYLQMCCFLLQLFCVNDLFFWRFTMCCVVSMFLLAFSSARLFVSKLKRLSFSNRTTSAFDYTELELLLLLDLCDDIPFLADSVGYFGLNLKWPNVHQPNNRNYYLLCTKL